MKNVKLKNSNLKRKNLVFSVDRLVKLFLLLFTNDVWELGFCEGKDRPTRRHKIKGNVQILYWKKGEQSYVDGIGHKEDVWLNLHKSWWNFFKPY